VAKQPKVKRLYLGFGDAYVPPVIPPAISCAFPLDATPEELVTLGLASKAVMTNEEQTGTYTYQGGLASSYSVGAAPAGVLATTSLIGFSTGNKMFEVGFAVDALVGTNTPPASVTARAQCFNSAGMDGLFIVVKANDTGNYITSLVTILGGSTTLAYESAATPTHPATLAVGVSAGVLSAWADGVPLVLLATAASTDDMFPLLTIAETPSLDATNAGRTASVTIRTDASTFLHSYPGWTDPCGKSAA